MKRKLFLLVRRSCSVGGFLFVFAISFLRMENAEAQLTANAGNDATICSGTSTQLNGSATGGTQPYSYSWSPTTNLSNPNIANPVAMLTSTTTYFLTVTDSLNNTSSDSVVLTVLSAPVMTISTTNSPSSCYTPYSVHFISQIVGGTAPFTFTWTFPGGCNFPNTTVSSSPNETYNCVGSFNVNYSVTDANGCFFNSTALNYININATCTVYGDTSICQGTSVSFNGTSIVGTPPYTYLWSPAIGLSNPNIANPIASPSTTTTYFLTVTDSLNNVITDSTVITVHPLPHACANIVSTSGCVPFCPQTNLSCSTGALTHALIDGWGGFINVPYSSFSNVPCQPLFNISGGINYHIIVIDSFGCTDDTVFNLTAYSPTPATFTYSNTNCTFPANVLFSPTGSGGNPLSYVWSFPGGTPNSVNTPSPSISYSSAGSYSATLILNNVFGCADTVTQIISLPTSTCFPIAHAGNDTMNCLTHPTQFHGSATGGTPPYTYSWNPNTGLSNPNIANPIANPNLTTTYVLTVTDANFLTDSDTIIYQVNQPPIVSITPGITTICSSYNYPIQINSVTSSGMIGYSILPLMINFPPNINPFYVTPTSTTTYTIEGYDFYGCSDTATVVINVGNVSSIISPSANQTICPGDSVTLTASGATNYLWSNGATTQIISVDTAGSFYVIGSSGTCSDTSAVVNVSLNSCTVPASLSVSNVTNNSAVVHWGSSVCAIGYQIYFRRSQYTNWQYANIGAGANSFTLSNLQNNYNVQWKIRTKCSNNTYTAWSAVQTFLTLPRIEGGNSSMENALEVSVFPNPTSGEIILQLNNYSDEVSVLVQDISGKMLQQTDFNVGNTSGKIQLSLADYSQGIYLITVIDGENRKCVKVVKE